MTYHHFAYLWSKTASFIFQTNPIVSKFEKKNMFPTTPMIRIKAQVGFVTHDSRSLSGFGILFPNDQFSILWRWAVYRHGHDKNSIKSRHRVFVWTFASHPWSAAAARWAYWSGCPRVPQGAPRVPQLPHLDPGRGWGWMNWDEGEWHFLKLDLVDSLALVVERTLHPNHPTMDDDRNRVIFFLGGLVWNHEPAMTMTPGKIRADEKWPGSNPTWSSWPVHQQAITGNHRKPSSIVTHHNQSSPNSSMAPILKNIL